MNERIDQLLVKAGAYFGAEGVDYASFEPKKFAELIIKECMILCQARADNPAAQGSFRDGALLCANDISELKNDP